MQTELVFKMRIYILLLSIIYALGLGAAPAGGAANSAGGAADSAGGAANSAGGDKPADFSKSNGELSKHKVCCSKWDGQRKKCIRNKKCRYNRRTKKCLHK